MAKHFYSPIDPYTESFVLPFRGKQLHVNFWGTPEKIGAQRFKLAMSFALPFCGKQQQVNFWCTPHTAPDCASSGGPFFIGSLFVIMMYLRGYLVISEAT